MLEHEARGSTLSTSLRCLRYREPSFIKKRHSLGPYSSPLRRALRGSSGGACFLMGEVPLQAYLVYVVQAGLIRAVHDSALYNTYVIFHGGTSLIRNRHPVGPYSRIMPRLLWRSWGGANFLMGEVPLHKCGFLHWKRSRAMHHGPLQLDMVTDWKQASSACGINNGRPWGAYRGTSLIRNSPPVGPYSSPMPRDLL